MFRNGKPIKSGLYDPAAEKDSCGVGFVAHIKGRASNTIIQNALTILQNMHHRGACGCDENSGDGAGILTTLPHPFLERVARTHLREQLPEPGRYAVGMIFLPTDPAERQACRIVVEKYVARQGQTMLGWRRVPTDNTTVGPTAKSTEPVIEQVFIKAADGLDPEAFERQLYLIRKQAFHQIKGAGFDRGDYFVCSLSSKIIVYKGQLTAGQLPDYFADLNEKDFVSHLAMVHSRFSTNTFPSWDRAQPMRFMCHNGEINTLAGNVNWMKARQGMMQTSLFGDEFSRLQPIIDPVTSDSGMFDNVLELLMMAGRTLPHAITMMIPEAWQQNDLMGAKRRAFYEYHSCLSEPWDGPASVAFTDGHYIGAVLDRNGLRPSRYYVTKDDLVIMASEVGVLPVDPADVKVKGRLQPGRMFLVDFEAGRIIDDTEIKAVLAREHDYASWISQQRIVLDDLPRPLPGGAGREGWDATSLLSRMQSLGYTVEDIEKLLAPMASGGEEAVGSMGNDTALACLSDQPRMLYDYFKQLFAQVTNPPIDSIREQLVMSLGCYIGPEGNQLAATPEHAHRVWLDQPILRNEQLAKLRTMDHRGWRTKTIDMVFDRPDAGANGHDRSAAALTAALDRICESASAAVEDGYSLILLSDRTVDQDRVAVPTLLAVSTVHHHLVSRGCRTRIGILVETAEAREVHHHCLLFGYGADAVNPYLAFECLCNMRRCGALPQHLTNEQVTENYIKAVCKGVLKVMSKMGVSTLQGYKGAQIFEAVGLNSRVIDRCFTGTASRVEGVGFEALAVEALRRHGLGFPRRKQAKRLAVLPNPGQYQWRRGGETHSVNPESLAALQIAARQNSAEAFDRFARLCDDESKSRCTLRGLFRFKTAQEAGLKPVDLDEVEPASEIVKRFCTGAMSLGALSPEAHETLAIAMNRIGGKSNTGEGGEDGRRYTPDPNGDLRRSAIKQVASARFGVTSHYLANADQLQIKIAQGAKPGEGGQLPGHKVDGYIASLRHAMPGVTLISPPPHHDIYSIEDLAQLIHDLKNANPSASVSVKLVSEMGVGTVAAGVAKAKADHILISGHDGGTGASPLTSIKHAGVPWELGLAETHQTLVLNDLRSRVRVEVDGGMRTGRDVVVGALLGAEEFGFSTMPLITLGCIMMRKCHLNTCPVGVATQDPELRRKFTGKPEHVITYLFLVAEQVRRTLASWGFHRLDQIVGRCDLLDLDAAIDHWKADGIDVSSILTPAERPRAETKVTCSVKQEHGLGEALDNELIQRAGSALEEGKAVRLRMAIRNTNRTVGTMLSHALTTRYGEAGLPHGTIHVRFDGSAGQSYAAWLAPGITFELAGDANDYTAKGLSGGRVIIYPPDPAIAGGFVPEDNIIVGNVALYGATSGQAFFRGIAGERFCVRNSGAIAVVEGTGDHACEYMTNGRVVILGPTGRNFAAGMSGGIAYVYDPHDHFEDHCNTEMVGVVPVSDEDDVAELRQLIRQHHKTTGSTVAAEILGGFHEAVRKFRKVMPHEYKRVLAERRQQEQEASAEPVVVVGGRSVSTPDYS